MHSPTPLPITGPAHRQEVILPIEDWTHGVNGLGHVRIDLGLNKGRGWFFKFFRGSSDFLLK
jgi:hypothetical protein